MSEVAVSNRPTADNTTFSIVAASTVLLRARSTLVRWLIVGAFLSVLFVLLRPRIYRTTVSFVPQGEEATRSNLASLAGQFGVALPGVATNLSPDFYARLTRSRVILMAVLEDTLKVPELSMFGLTTLDVLQVEDGPMPVRLEQGLRKLRQLSNVSVDKNTGLVELTVRTKWPTASAEIAQSFLEAVNRFNVRSAQLRAASERAFVEDRLQVTRVELRAAEDALEAFLRTNRQYERDPALVVSRERLQRIVGLRQSVYVTLTEAYEEVRMREVRATPMFTIVDSEYIPARPESRQGAAIVLVGSVLSVLIGSALVLLSQRYRAGRRPGDDEVWDLFNEMRLAFPFRNRLRRGPHD